MEKSCKFVIISPKKSVTVATNIIGREIEKEKLNKILQSDQAEFMAIYGRRRVGKTFLIRQHLKENIVFEISGTKEGTIACS